MAYSSVTYTGPSGTPTWSLPFEVIDGDYIYMKVGGVATTSFTVDVSAQTATWTGSSLAGTETIYIYRTTPVTAATEEVSWQPGPVSDADLALEQKKRRAVDQELSDTVVGMDTHVATDSIHVPSGGDTGQFLNKASGDSGDTQWVEGIQLTVPDPPDGGVITWNATGNPIHLAAGTSGQFLRANGAGSPPSWETVSGSGLGDVIGPGTHANNTLAIYSGADSNTIKEDTLIKRTTAGVLEAKTFRGNNTGGAGSACVALSTDATTVLTTGVASPEGSITGIAGTMYFQTVAGTPANCRIWHNRSGSTAWTEIGSGSSAAAKTYAYAQGYESPPLAITTSYQELNLNAGSVNVLDTDWSVVSDTELTWGGSATKRIQITAGLSARGKTTSTEPPQVQARVLINGVEQTGGFMLSGMEYWAAAIAKAAITMSATFIVDIAAGQAITVEAKKLDTAGDSELLIARVSIMEVG